MRFDFSDTQYYTKIGVCEDTDTNLGLNLGHIVEPSDARNSVLHFKLNSTELSNRIPLLGLGVQRFIMKVLYLLNNG